VDCQEMVEPLVNSKVLVGRLRVKNIFTGLRNCRRWPVSRKLRQSEKESAILGKGEDP